jgi:uncharacterized protein (DUF1330 family)
LVKSASIYKTIPKRHRTGNAGAIQFVDWSVVVLSCEIVVTARSIQCRATDQGAKTMSVYMIADIRVTDDKWLPAYAASVHDLVHKHGGKYLARSGNVKTLEGKPLDTTLIALLEFPSPDAVKAFATDPKYVPYAAARQHGSESRLHLIDDTDLAGTIPYLPKG